MELMAELGLKSAREGLNFRPSGYKTDALFTELRGQFHSRALFSVQLVRGVRMRKMLKYSRDAICPMMT